MILVRRVRAILKWLFRRKREEQQLDSELQTFVDFSAAEKIREGVPPEEARRLARLEIGGIDQVKERVRTGRHGGLLDDLGRDVRYGARALKRNPALTATIVVTLALGIGANTAIFGLIDSLMLRWLPVHNPQELVQIKFQTGDTGESFSYAIVRAFANRKELFDGVAGFSGHSFNVGLPGSTTRVAGAYVTGGYYDTLGLQPAAGRLLAPRDDEAGAPAVAVIGDAYWERQFARNANVVGQTLSVNGIPVEIAGVSPAGFAGANVGEVADITLPAAAIARIHPAEAGLLDRGNFWLRILARPRAGLSAAEVQSRLALAWAQMTGEVIPPWWPAFQRDSLSRATFEMSPGGTGWTYLRNIYRRPLWVLMAMVAVVLLIGCANVASLLLGRASARQRETAVRLAIGAGRGRIVRQFLIETTLLSLIGGAFGVVLAWVSGRFLLNILSTGPGEVVLDLTPNWHVLGFTFTVAVTTGILFGLGPALHMTAASPSEVLKDDTRMTSSRSRLLPVLVAAQVALSLVLLVGAGLFVRTLKNLQGFDPGFQREGVLLVNFEGMRTAFPQILLDEVRQLPGVVSASLSTHTPLSRALWTDAAVPKGQSVPENDNAIFIGAGPNFFGTMQTRLRAGREFTERDSRDNVPVAIINEAYAKRFFSNRNAIGEHLSARVRHDLRDLEIVGVATNTHATSIRRAPDPTVYVSYAQLTGDFPTTLEIRTAGPLSRVDAGIKTMFQSRMPNVSISTLALSAQVESTMVQERMIATLATGFGLLALSMACLGIYGLLAYSVAQRTKEIGVRMALGARGIDVVALTLKSVARLVVIGAAVGLPLAWIASRWVESILFGMKPADPAAIGGAVLLMTAAGLIAAYLPARRASRIDPIVALRHE